MKKTLGKIAMAIVVLCVMASCGSSKVSLGKEYEKSPAQVYAEENPKLRAWGEGMSVDRSIAEGKAEAQARAKITKAIESAVEVAVKKYAKETDVSTSDDIKSGTVADTQKNYEELTVTVAKQMVKSFVPVKQDAYLQKNGQTRVFVCLEYSGSKASFLEEITAHVFDEIVNGQIPEEKKQQILEQREQFQQEFDKELNLGNSKE